MVEIQSKEVIDKVSDELKIQPSGTIPRGLIEKIQLSYSINPVPKNRYLVNAARAATTAGLIVLTTHTTKRTFITGARMINVSDATATNTKIELDAVMSEDGVRHQLIAFPKITATAFSANENITFPIPIELQKGSTVVFTNSFGAGVSTSHVALIGYETDPQ